ncbi:hypothetical protein TREPR_2446 [Treponema primitia ZAS-2]|uniref:Uncharacterized protein n=1 Tax=Treponema primitia (strain ATCC BAA-887 / DSM 12427 / ZAS-2) TaxID=545694 RepID=F5YH56_TREPZ|nr:hypothetical protein [Treponema primitia]AEF85464.1 hypothetical protein TREPR_2446 [Treponema primitia ZAS-2]
MSLAYSKNMDERKKTIRELEEKRREVQSSIDGILQALGKNLLVRLDGENSGAFAQELGEYRRILGDIKESEESIREIEADTLHVKDLEGEINRKEQGNLEKNKELSELYTHLGGILLEKGEFASFDAPYRHQAEALVQKIQSLDERIGELDGAKNANIFAWIGKSTQGMVLRSLLTKSQAGLSKLYTAAGEKFASLNNQVLDNPALQDIMETVLRVRAEAAELGEALAKLRSEHREIGEALGQDGSPAKKTQELERHISHARGQLAALFLRVGGLMAAKKPGGEISEGESLSLSVDDMGALDKVGTLRGEIAEYEGCIEKLKASLAIDAAREEIEKMEKSITGHRQRIRASEEAIADLEKRIDESNQHIQKLMNMEYNKTPSGF